MATRKKTTRKRGREVAPGRFSRAKFAARLERELPRRVGVYVNDVQQLLDRLEREIQRASQRTRMQATRLLRQASRQLGSIEAGQSNWARLVARYREEAARVLRTLEGAIAPSTSPALRSRKLPTRRASRRARTTRTARKTRTSRGSTRTARKRRR